jgi:uncharacterized integral membrane protein (TIGR00701 family)
MSAYYYVLAIHIIFVVSWMAGLFYSVRLFIYHTEANDRPELERVILQQEYEKIERKLWNIIATPAMVLSLIAGITMVCISPVLENALAACKACFCCWFSHLSFHLSADYESARSWHIQAEFIQVEAME